MSGLVSEKINLKAVDDLARLASTGAVIDTHGIDINETLSMDKDGDLYLTFDEYKAANEEKDSNSMALIIDDKSRDNIYRAQFHRLAADVKAIARHNIDSEDRCANMWDVADQRRKDYHTIQSKEFWGLFGENETVNHAGDLLRTAALMVCQTRNPAKNAEKVTVIRNILENSVNYGSTAVNAVLDQMADLYPEEVGQLLNRFFENPEKLDSGIVCSLVEKIKYAPMGQRFNLFAKIVTRSKKVPVSAISVIVDLPAEAQLEALRYDYNPNNHHIVEILDKLQGTRRARAYAILITHSNKEVRRMANEKFNALMSLSEKDAIRDEITRIEREIALCINNSSRD